MEQLSLLFLFMLFAWTTTTVVVQCTPMDIFILGGQSNMVGQGEYKIIPPDHECQSNPRILCLNNNSQWEQAQEPLHKGLGLKKNQSKGSGAVHPMDIFILGGQSNMVGQGEYKIIPPDHECQSNPRILCLNNNSQWEQAQEPLHKGLGLKKNQSCGIGPGMPIGETIGLIPCTVVASYIDDWKRGSSYYNWTMVRARAAVSNSGGTIRALLWYQGESDSGTAKSYKGKLVQFFTDLRNDLHLPSLPIIQVAIAKGYKFDYIVREAQLTLRLPKVYTVDAQKLNATLLYNIHLDTPAQIKLGKELADVYRNISAL